MRNKFAFVERKLCPFVALPNVPHGSPAGLDCAWGRAGLGAGAHKAAGDTALGRALFPGKSAPSHSPHPKTTAVCHTLVPDRVRYCFLPSPTTDQNPHQIKVPPVTPIWPIVLEWAGQWALRTREGLYVSLCPALGRPHSF